MVFLVAPPGSLASALPHSRPSPGPPPVSALAALALSSPPAPQPIRAGVTNTNPRRGTGRWRCLVGGWAAAGIAGWRAATWGGWRGGLCGIHDGEQGSGKGSLGTDGMGRREGMELGWSWGWSWLVAVVWWEEECAGIKLKLGLARLLGSSPPPPSPSRRYQATSCHSFPFFSLTSQP